MGIILLKLFVSMVVAVGLWGFACDVADFVCPREEASGGRRK